MFDLYKREVGPNTSYSQFLIDIALFTAQFFTDVFTKLKEKCLCSSLSSNNSLLSVVVPPRLENIEVH